MTLRETPTGPVSCDTICTVKWFEPPNPARVEGDFQSHTDLPPLDRRQHLLSGEIREPFVLVPFIWHDGKVGLDPHERDPVGLHLGAERPLVERQVPVLTVQDNVAGPRHRILDAALSEILRQSSPQARIRQFEIPARAPAPRRRRP